MTTPARHSRRQLIGLVTATKMQKTVSVEVQRTFKHKKYGKFLRRRKRYLAHDEQPLSQVGDTVVIESTRPLSRRKCWRVVQVLSRSQLAAAEAFDPTAEAMESIGAVKAPRGEAGDR